MPNTPLERIAQFVAEHTFLPDAETIEVARNALIDTLGCIVVGSRQPVAIKTRNTVAVWGDGPAQLFGTPIKLAAPWAALANSTAGHALDFDDWEIPGNSHSSITILPALMTIAAFKPISGKAFLDAYLAGFEVIARIGEAVNFEHYDAGWHSTATLGAYGAAAGVARLLKLNSEQTAHAISISFSQAVGYTKQFGSNAKPLQAGFAAKAGVLAGSLAANGLTGQAWILDDPRGFIGLMGNGDRSRFPDALARLGNPLALTEWGQVVKPYPSCGYTHRVIDCALELRGRLKGAIRPENIARVTASLPDFHANILPFLNPQERAEALFSVPYTTSHALLNGPLTLSDIEAETWTNQDMQDLISKFDFQVRKPINPELNYDPADPDFVEIEFVNGTKERVEVAYPLGAPQNRMSSQQIWEKFISNCATDHDLQPLKSWIESNDINQLLTNTVGKIVE